MTDKTGMPIHIAPNRPLYVALADPQSDSEQYDFDLRMGRYQTVDGRVLALPRSAVIKLNELSPRPGKEIQITKIWSGRPAEQPEWSICLSTRSEKARAAEEAEGQGLVPVPQASIEQDQAGKSSVAPPTPISAPKKPAKPTEQPRLFDRGTGTHGPAPRPLLPEPTPVARPVAAASPVRTRPEQIPANVAVREILQFINADQSTKNWGGDEKQDLLSTILIAAYKAGQVGLWERGE